MNEASGKHVVREFIEKVVNTGNLERIPEFVDQDIDGMRAHVAGVRETFPDLTVTIEQQVAEGEWVASRVVARGTHSGWWAGIKPTGKAVTITGVNLDRVRNGRIVEHGGAANMFEALLEIGAIRPVADET